MSCHTGRGEMNTEPKNIDQRLLVLYLLDEISQQGRDKVEAWLSLSEDNRNYFDGLQKTWDATGRIEPASVAFDTDAAWHRMKARMGEEQKRSEAEEVRSKGGQKVNRPPSNSSIGLPSSSLPSNDLSSSPDPSSSLVPSSSSSRFVRYAIAAAAVLVIGIFSAVFVRMMQNRQDAGFVTLAATTVPVQDTLKDGSSVVLNANTELKVPKSFAKTNRKVELRGEAFFQVEHDAANPFIIDAGLGQVKVLGTSFHVRAYPGAALEVYVETGRVELSRVDPLSGDTVRTILKAGERGEIRQGTEEIVKPAAIGPDELFWANKKLIFQETRLSVVFDLLKKHYEAVIEVKDSTILNCMLSATFTDESIDQILEVVAASFDLTVSRDQDKFIFNGKGCGNE